VALGQLPDLAPELLRGVADLLLTLALPFLPAVRLVGGLA